MVLTAEQIERLLLEDVLTATQATRLLPPVKGKKRCAESIIRWIEEGKHGVHLEGFAGPDKCYFTTRQALARFLAALTARRRGLSAGPALVDQDRARAAGEVIRGLRRKKESV